MGRKHSKQVVEDLIKDYPKMASGSSWVFGHKPHSLNFAAVGTLNRNGIIYKGVVLAQGHSNSQNNWWVGALSGHYTRNYGGREKICTIKDVFEYPGLPIGGGMHRKGYHSNDPYRFMTIQLY